MLRVGFGCYQLFCCGYEFRLWLLVVGLVWLLGLLLIGFLGFCGGWVWCDTIGFGFDVA